MELNYKHFKVDQMVRYNGAEHKVVGILIERSGGTSKVMLAIDGKITIINSNEIN